MITINFPSFVEEYICDFVIFLYKIGETLLDSSIRPYISTAVCSDMFDNSEGPDGYEADDKDWWLNHHYRLRFRGYRNSTVVCSESEHLPDEIADEVQQQAAGVLVAYRLLVSIPAVILGLFCGAWSDTEGCKLPMMTPSAGSCAAVVFYLLSLHVRHAKVALLLAGASMQGFLGKTSVITMAVNSHVSYTSQSEQRTRRLGRLLASSYLGMFLGALLAGILQDVSNLTYTFTCVSVCHALCVFAILLGVTNVLPPENGTNEDLFVKPESNHIKLDPDKAETEVAKGEKAEDKGQEGGEKKEKEYEWIAEGREKEGGEKKQKEYGLFSWEGLMESVMTVVKKREGGKRCVIVLCLVVLTVTQILKIGDQDVTVMFVQHPPLSWPSFLYGYLTAADSGMMGIALLLLLPVLSNVLFVSDIHIVLLGITFRLVRTMWAGFCSRTWMMFASVLVGALGGVVSPALRSILSKTAHDGEVGKLFSIQAALETLSKLIGSVVFTGIYAATVDFFPPAAYLAELAVYILMAALLLWLGRLLREDGSHELLLAVAKPKYSTEQNNSGKSKDSPLLSSLSSENLPKNPNQDGDRTESRKKGDIFHLGAASTP